jgi:hypothetical protein
VAVGPEAVLAVEAGQVVLEAVEDRRVVAEEGAAVALNRSNAHVSRAAVTLLELLLALSLSVLVLMAISMAISLHFKMLNVRRTNVEESQVVRAVVRHITEDLRDTLYFTPPDLSGLETAMQNAMQAVAKQATSSLPQTAVIGSGPNIVAGAPGGASPGGAGGQSGGQATSGQTGAGQGGQGGAANTQGGGNQNSQGNQSKTGGSGQGGATGSAQAGGSSGTANGSQSSADGTTSDTAATPTGVRLVGSSYELRIDISRLPRIDQYKASQGTGKTANSVTMPSDVKTVVYFLATEASNASAAGPRSGYVEPSADGRGKGLMRTEIDRVLSAWAETNGNTTSSYDNAKLLAHEVIGLEFEYFDGVDWVYDWDSSSMGGLPRAVKVILTVQPQYALNEKDLAKSAASGKPPPEQTFRVVVAIPAAPLYKVAEPTTDSSSANSATSTNSSSSGATATGTTP